MVYPTYQSKADVGCVRRGEDTRTNGWKILWGSCLSLLAAGCTSIASPPQPPKATNMPVCTRPPVMVNRSYLVFFDQHSAVVSERGKTIETEFTQNRRVTLAEIQGNLDTSETAPRDRGLGLRRAKAVAAALIGLGVPTERLIMRDFGTSRPLVPTPPGTSEPQNRRVAIILLAGDRPGAGQERQECVDWLTATYCAANPDSSVAAACHNAVKYLQYLH